jgi:hypothetical protein
MGLEINVERTAAGPFTGLIEHNHFSVFHPVIGVKSFACDRAGGINNDCADVWIRRGQSNALPRQIESAAQKVFVCRVKRHYERRGL